MKTTLYTCATILTLTVSCQSKNERLISSNDALRVDNAKQQIIPKKDFSRILRGYINNIKKKGKKPVLVVEITRTNCDTTFLRLYSTYYPNSCKFADYDYKGFLDDYSFRVYTGANNLIAQKKCIENDSIQISGYNPPRWSIVITKNNAYVQDSMTSLAGCNFIKMKFYQHKP